MNWNYALVRCSRLATSQSAGLHSILPMSRSRQHINVQALRNLLTSTEPGATTTTGKEEEQGQLTLYQYAICPYCNIAKSVLHYTQTPYQFREVNPLTKAEIKTLPGKEYKKVPILVVQDDRVVSDKLEQVNGSESIVQYLLDHLSESSAVPAIDSSSASAVRWTNFAREDLAPLLYPNLCDTIGNSYRAFGYVHNSPSPFSVAQRYSIQWLGSLAMYMAASKIKKKRNISDERAALMEALAELNTELEQLPSSSSFLSSSSAPHLGDLTIYGVLRGLHGLPVVDTVNQEYPRIEKWYHQMEQVVERKHE